MARAKQWLSKCGWSVGGAEVRDCVDHLRVFVPIRSLAEWVERPLSGSPRWITVDRHRVCDVPAGTDPVEAVRLCSVFGQVREDGGHHPDAVPMVNTVNVVSLYDMSRERPVFTITNRGDR